MLLYVIIIVFTAILQSTTYRLAQLLNTLLSVRDVSDSIPGPVKPNTVSPTARQHCDVSSDLCCPGVKPRR